MNIAPPQWPDMYEKHSGQFFLHIAEYTVDMRTMSILSYSMTRIKSVCNSTSNFGFQGWIHPLLHCAIELTVAVGFGGFDRRRGLGVRQHTTPGFPAEDLPAPQYA